jgi:hypothetical protein
MKTAASPSVGKAAGPNRRVARRRAAVAFAALLAAALAGVAFVMAQSPVPIVATVRHAPTLNGRIEGSVQMLAGEYVNLNSGNVVKGDLLVPGTPAVVINGTPVYQGTLNGTGSTQPSNYQVTLNSGAELGHVVRRTDPVTLAPVPVPPAPTGTRYVTINSPGQSVGTWATVRNLTLNSNVGSYTVPAGTYGAFTANGGGAFVLGVAGATQASVYNFEDITLNSFSNLYVVGPVVVNVANRVTLNSSCVMGSAANPRWLALNVSRYDVTINGGEINGLVRAPAGSVTVSAGRLRGSVSSDRLTVNGGTLIGVSTDTTAPTLAITQPAEGLLTQSASVNVTGTFSDESATTVAVNGVAATISGNTYSASVPLAEGANTLRAVATDSAGNSSQATRTVTRDSTPPTLSIQQPAAGLTTSAAEVTVSGAYADQSSTAVRVNGVTAALQGGGYTATVPLSEGANTLSVVATDAAGNQAQAARDVVRDSAAPALAIAEPAEGFATNATSIIVTGTLSDATVTSVRVNDVPAEISNGSFTANVPLAVEGTNTLRAVATDAAGNQTAATRLVTRDTVAPALTLNNPAAGVIARRLSVNGTATDALPVTVTMNGIELSLAAGGAFDNQFDMPEGTWDVRVVASDTAGNRSELTRSVTIDTTPPVIGELSPPDGEKVESPATVRGRVTDANPSTVKVNNREASVDAAGAFTASGVALNEGSNQVSVSAVDAAGNESAATLSLVGRDHTPPAAPTLFAVTTPTRLALQAVEGRAEPGAVVTLTGGAEPATADASFGNGHFVANVKLAAGVNNLSVVATDADGNASPPAQVSILSNPAAPPPAAGQPAQINISTGNTQKGLVNTELPRPLIAIVTDSTGAPLSGVSVRFTAQEGGGHFVGGGDTFESPTDERGYASARYVSGAAPGLQQVRSDFPGNAVTPAVFLAEAFEAEAGAETLVSGTVLDQNLRALPNVLVRLGGQQTRTGADGIFVLHNVASGPHQLLELIGRDQITLPGRWPNITYDMDVLPGIDNEPGRPLFLPKVNEGVAMPLDEQGVLTHDVVVELPVAAGEPPVRVTARAGTHVTFPPDATDKRLSVTRIAAGRVPMALEDGRATNLYISVQPSGALFEPPLEVSFPNLDRQPAESEVLVMSFDHDAGRYVKVGTAHVSADGRSVKSDPGMGIRVGAWHGTPPDPPKPQVTVLGQIQLDGNPAFQNKVVTRLDAWVDGVRAVLSPGVSSSPPVVQAMATLTLAEGDVHSSAVQAKAQTAQITVAPTEVFVGVNGEKEVTATVAPPTPGTFTWQSDSTNTATVTPDSANPSVAKIKGVKKGKTKVTVTFVDPNNPKAKLKAEVKVNVGAVTYKKVADCAGFDDTQKDASGNPIPWLVVPTGGNNTAKADIEPDAAATHVTFSSLAPGTATVAPAQAAADNQVLTVTGVAKGTTDIEAKFDNTSSDKLKVAVKDKKTVRVSFHFVADTKTSGNGIDHKTSRRGTQAEEDAFADAMIARMNAIWTPQANVVFEKKLVRDVQVPTNLGDKVETTGTGLSAEFTAVTALGDAGADWNIFLVWSLSVTGVNATEVDGATVTGGRDTLYEDDGGTDVGESLAHEAGHKFGIRGRSATGFQQGDYNEAERINELMYYATDVRGCFVRKGQADIANP